MTNEMTLRLKNSRPETNQGSETADANVPNAVPIETVKEVRIKLLFDKRLAE